MTIRLAVNGFGRIGRYLIRLLADASDVEIVAVNARADNATLAHLLKYDSTFGPFPFPVSATENGIMVNGREIPVTRAGLGEWDWKPFNVDVVVESTGKVKKRADLARHLEAGAAKVINDTVGIRHGLMTTIHSYTMSQRILDGSHKDLRRARACAMSMIPTSTGAAKATALVIPALKGKLDGMAVRVPTPNVSLVDLTCELERDADAASVNAALKAASEGPMKDNMGYCEEPLVSVDFNGSTCGGVVDSLLTAVMDKRMLKLIIWYDNEAGFTNQLARLVRLVGGRR